MDRYPPGRRLVPAADHRPAGGRCRINQRYPGKRAPAHAFSVSDAPCRLGGGRQAGEANERSNRPAPAGRRPLPRPRLGPHPCQDPQDRAGGIHRRSPGGHRHRGGQPLQYPDPQRRDVQPLCQRPAAAGHHHPGHPRRDLRRHRQGAGVHQRGVGYLVRPQLFQRPLRQPDHHLHRPCHRRGSGVHRPHPGRRGLRRDQPGADAAPFVRGRRQPGQGGHHLPGLPSAVRGRL